MNRSAFARYIPPVVLLALIIGLAGVANASSISVGVTPQNYKSLTVDLGLGKREPATMGRDDCPDLQSDKLNNIGRGVAEIAIICNSIFEAGLTDRIKLIHHLPHRRRLNEIAAGTIDVSGNTIFPEAADTLTVKTHPLLSNAVIRVGEFEKAIFTLPGRDDVLTVSSLEALRRFKAITVKFWVVDVKTLKAMKLKRVIEVTKPSLYARFLEAGRADFLISEFNTNSVISWGANMARVPGVKVSLMSPRVFPVSPHRDDVQRAINDYLEKARAGETDLVKQVFLKAGFFKPEFSGWTLLFPEN
ncbi:MAG: hypothetical protein H8E94_04025 [Alphaproteobacteria bacterium]|nr:hypothetical protein [Alphaproteobacteria bacterium]